VSERAPVVPAVVPALVSVPAAVSGLVPAQVSVWWYNNNDTAQVYYNNLKNW
jgi:hypothetical protein